MFIEGKVLGLITFPVAVWNFAGWRLFRSEFLLSFVHAGSGSADDVCPTEMWSWAKGPFSAAARSRGSFPRESLQLAAHPQPGSVLQAAFV